MRGIRHVSESRAYDSSMYCRSRSGHLEADKAGQRDLTALICQTDVMHSEGRLANRSGTIQLLLPHSPVSYSGSGIISRARLWDFHHHGLVVDSERATELS